MRRVESDFSPPFYLSHTHTQSLLASAGPRRALAERRAKGLCAVAQETLLDCGNGVRLQGFYSPSKLGAEGSLGLVILFHGWLGKESSSYMLSAGGHLYELGYSVFRLNFRDHGESHHLNEALFHSARVDEVINAVAEIQRVFPHQHNFLAGFSLGGNFALRVAARHNTRTTKLDQVVSVCPVVDPKSAMAMISDAMWVYPWYFVLKWKRSLRKKLEAFPQLDFGDEMERSSSLDDLNEFFVPNHTPYAEVDDYFEGYSVAGPAENGMAELPVPTHIIHSIDDPVVPAADLDKLVSNDHLSIETPEHGGHCGFLSNVKMESWVDPRLHELFSAAVANKT